MTCKLEQSCWVSQFWCTGPERASSNIAQYPLLSIPPPTNLPQTSSPHSLLSLSDDSFLLKLSPLLLHLLLLRIHQQLQMARPFRQTSLRLVDQSRRQLLHRLALFCELGFFRSDYAGTE